MATKTAQTAVAVSSDIADLFESDGFMGEARALPHAQILNHEANFGLFIKEESMKRVGWTGPDANLNHRFRTGAVEPGWLSRAPYIKVLRRSARFVEDRATKAILANYETADGRALRDQRGDETTLRTLWLIYVCDEQGNRYHKIPLVLSVHGAAAARLGGQYDMFCQGVDDAYAKISGKELIAARDQKVYSLFTFNPTFDLEYVGEGQKSSPVAIVADFTAPTPENFMQIIATGSDKDFLWQASEAYRGFDARYLKSCEKAYGFQIAPSLIDPETGEISFGAEAPALSGMSDRGAVSLA